MHVPFGERGGAARGLLDAVCGRFPRFVFGGAVPGRTLPVFHFHDVTADAFEPALRYLAENGYGTVTSDEIAAHARGEASFEATHVGLCFDDAWASVWTVAKPLLARYGMRAITYAIPARMEEADGCRPEGAAGGPPFATWPELTALHASGFVDVQSHTHTHSMVFCSWTVRGFVTPEYAGLPMLNRPQISGLPSLRFVEPEQLGAPLYTARSRMSDALCVEVSPDAQARCVEYVARHGGAAFFERLDWEERLRHLAVAPTRGSRHVESEAERERAIERELADSRSILNDRLRTNTVRHICLPWGVSSDTTLAALKRTGYVSAFANRMEGRFAVETGDDPYWLKRLPNKYIFHLPGRGRRTWF